MVKLELLWSFLFLFKFNDFHSSIIYFQVGTFQDLLKDLFTICETELTRRQSEKLTTGYSHSTEETQKRNEFKKYIKSNLHPKVEVRKNAWRKLVTDMLSGLLSEEDEYLRSLAWRLDFSRHYYKAWGFRGSLEKWEKKNLVDFRTVNLFSSS